MIKGENIMPKMKKEKRAPGFSRNKSGSAGSITVLVTLILVPTIIVNAFFVDIARLKLWSNQAVMTADNYGEGVLTVYDNILKELYGLFAVSQSTEGKKAIDELDGYIKSSFNPNESTITWKHSAAFGTTSYSGFMPYSGAEIELKWEPEQNANLANNRVLITQIGDFMRFRIVQAMSGAGEGILEAWDEIKNIAGNAAALKDKRELDEKINDLFDAVKAFYYLARDAAEYPDYINDVNHARASAYDKIREIGESESLETYIEYTENSDAILQAALHKAELENPSESNGDDQVPPLTEEEERLLEIKERYDNDPDARKNVLQRKFLDAYTPLTDAIAAGPINFDNFETYGSRLEAAADQIKSSYSKVRDKLDELESTLNSESVSQTLKDGIREDIETIKLAIPDTERGADPYYRLLDEFRNTNKSAARNTHLNYVFNSEAKDTAEDCVRDMRQRAAKYLEGGTVETNNQVGNINSSSYNNFKFDTGSKNLYDNLAALFEETSNDSKESNRKKKAAEDKTAEVEETLSGKENTDARDIPESFSMGTDSGIADNLTINRLIDTIADLFDADSLGDGANKALLNFYTVAYDFSMFSSRVTNVEKKSSGSSGSSGSGPDSSEQTKAAAESLTGYTMSKEINYLYKAELEYIFGGHKSSADNLAEVRNKILTFRAICNFVASYQIKAIDTPIRTAGRAASAVNPLLGIVVEAALRLAVVAVESAADWNALKEGDSVCVTKDSIDDLTAFDSIKDLIGEDNSSSSPSGDKKKFKLDYEQYLMVLIVFLTPGDTIATRTGNLIELNVNTVKQKIGEGGVLTNLEFALKDAVTAVKATASVQLDFAIMPKDMAKLFLDESKYDDLGKYEKNEYVFHVSRSY